MPEHYHYDEGDLVNPETHHETSDVNVRAIIWFGIIIVIFAVVTHFLVYFIYKAFVVEERNRARQAGSMSEVRPAADAAVPKNQPLLQPFPRSTGKPGEFQAPYRNTPVTDLAAMRDAEQKALASYGWVDQQKGIVRMPITTAMQLAVQRGLPVQSQLPPPVAAPTDATGGEGAAVVKARKMEARP